MFPNENADWVARRTAVTSALEGRFADDGLMPGAYGLVVVTAGAGGMPMGFAVNGNWRCYPCSLVKAFHLVHALNAIEAGRLVPHDDLDRAMTDMIRWSSNTATNYVIDLLTDTTGDTRLQAEALRDWIARRETLNRFFAGLDWPEFAGCNITQKLMDDTRYGREAQFAALNGGYLNALTPLSAARLLWELFEGNLPLDAPSRAAAQNTLRRDPQSPDAANPHYQLAEYLGGALPEGTRIWSKAGHNLWTGDAKASWFKHDMIRFQLPGRHAIIAVLMTQGRRICEEKPMVFPQIGCMLSELLADAALPVTSDE